MITPWPIQWRGAGMALAVVLSCSPAAAATKPAPAAVMDTEIGQNAWTLGIPPGHSAPEIRAALVAVLHRREWTVQSQSGDRVVGYLKHRTNEARVTLVYSATQVEAFCVGWAIDKKTGARLKPEQPKGWLGNLKSDLLKQLNRGAVGK